MRAGCDSRRRLAAADDHAELTQGVILAARAAVDGAALPVAERELPRQRCGLRVEMQVAGGEEMEVGEGGGEGDDTVRFDDADKLGDEGTDWLGEPVGIER